VADCAISATTSSLTFERDALVGILVARTTTRTGTWVPAKAVFTQWPSPKS
jgi:hypothetical protein